MQACGRPQTPGVTFIPGGGQLSVPLGSPQGWLCLADGPLRGPFPRPAAVTSEPCSQVLPGPASAETRRGRRQSQHRLRERDPSPKARALPSPSAPGLVFRPDSPLPPERSCLVAPPNLAPGVPERAGTSPLASTRLHTAGAQLARADHTPRTVPPVPVRRERDRAGGPRTRGVQRAG